MSPHFRKLGHQEIQESKPSIKEVQKFKRMPLYLIFDNIRSLYNVGAMFRTADAVLAQKIYLCGITGYPPRKEIDKVALGAVEVVPWEYRSNAVEVVTELKKEGVTICALELTEPTEHFKKADYPFPLALIIGNEIEGVDEKLMSMIDMAVSIPMMGRANSLNVATALGVVAYEILFQYEQKFSTSS